MASSQGIRAGKAFVELFADDTKLVETLGQFPLPIEVNRFGAESTRLAIIKAATRLGLAGTVAFRLASGELLVTDEGHYIVDASFGRIHDAKALSDALLSIAGVVQHGLFLGMADTAIVCGPAGLREIRN